MKKLRKSRKKRGVVRTIDFTVAFSLFIVIYVQFLLVLINTSFLLNTLETSQNPAKDLAERLLNRSGYSISGNTTDWASVSSVPDELGLLSSFSTANQHYLDLNKLSRLNPDLISYSSSSNINLDWVSLSDRTDLGLAENYQNIRITTRPFLNVSVSSAMISGNISSITLTVQSGKFLQPVEGIDVVYGIYDLGNHSWIGSDSAQTGLGGITTFSVSPLVSIPNNPYLIVAYAEMPSIGNNYQNMPYWGFGWTAYTPVGSTLQLDGISSVSFSNSTNLHQLVKSTTSGLQVYAQTFFPFRDRTLPTNNLTLNQGNFTFSNGEVSLNTNYTSGTEPIFTIGFSNSSLSNFFYQISSDPMIFYSKTSTQSGVQGYPSFSSVETTSFSQLEKENSFKKVYVYETTVFSNKGPFIIRFEVASLQ